MRSRRHVLACILACGVSLAWIGPVAGQGRLLPAPQPSASQASAPAAATRAVVVVTGDGEAVAQAGAVFWVGDARWLTATSGEEGEVSLALSGPTLVRVRVIAQGWETYFGELELAPGKRSVIKLTRSKPHR